MGLLALVSGIAVGLAALLLIGFVAYLLILAQEFKH